MSKWLKTQSKDFYAGGINKFKQNKKKSFLMGKNALKDGYYLEK